MSTFITLILSLLIGYIFGAIPFGYILVKIAKQVDLREIGSGRTGGTNAFRAAGVATGVITSILDVLKGACAVWVTRALFADAVSTEWLPWLVAAAGVMSVAGHNWSVFIGWKGGAGTGPNVGWAMAVWWPVAIITCIVGGVLLISVGMASVASLAVAALIPIIFAVRYFTGADPTAAHMVGGLITAAIVTWALRPNISRIIAGEERLVGPAAKRREKKESA